MPSSAAAPRKEVDRRRHRRVGTRLDACLDGGGQLVPCVIVDVSSGGAQVLAELPADIDRVRLDIEAFGTFECRVVWATDTRAGLEFLEDPQSTTARLAELLAGA
ncbi:MAG: PilZ domain-containing protein [Alphaproteobacteria bacterium]|nr:PilZ domain-containing protein [Alphaproteobacteria bacterium]